MRKFLVAVLITLSAFAYAPALQAQETGPQDEQDERVAPAVPYTVVNDYYKGTVEEIVAEEVISIGGFRQPYQRAKIKIINGPNEGRVFEHDYQLPQSDKEANRLRVGEKVVVVRVTSEDGEDFYIAEKYRLPSVYLLFFGFFALAVIFGRWKGFSSVLGLAFSLVVIVKFVLPQIVAGRSPVVVSIIGGLAILIVSLYLAHGFQKRTTVALVGTLIALTLAALLAAFAVSFAKLFGLGSEEALTLLQAPTQNINLRGLLLGGIIIGSLGVLDDITTAQAATVDELHRANPSLSFSELYHRGLSVGREHIASLVNTLALAYVGASLPIMLIFTKTDFPFWVTFNSEFVVEEIVRTLVGSMALMMAVPITTTLAAYVFSKETDSPPPNSQGHGHHH